MSTSVKYQVMPPLSPDEYQELHDDIAHRGVVEPIHVDESGVVIDGHHRKRIADELGIECPKIVHDDLSDAGKRSLAFTLNLKRRHLNREQRRALIAESLKSDPQLSNREHARRTGASDNTVGSVRREMEESAQIAHFEKRQDPRTGNLSQSASQPSRPEPEEPELPQATALPQSDLDELNAEPPTWQPAGHLRDTDLNDLKKEKTQHDQPRSEAITNQFTSAISDLTRVANRFRRIADDKNFPRNKEKVAAMHRHDLNRLIGELQTIADEIN